MPKVIENKLIEEFKGREYFTREDLFEFYRYFEPNLKEGTFGWRIYDLKAKNIIRPLKRGLYVISYKPKYKPEISPKVIKLAKRITDKFKDAKHCIWETEWLNEFSQHQASKRIILIEIEKDLIESLYFELKDWSRNELYFNPDEKVIDFYIAESNNPVVIRKLVTRSPITRRTEKRVKFYTPSLEKILVDLFAEEKLFYYLQGSELMNIYENAISNYAVNFTKLFSYAKRREREQDIKQFMMEHINHLVKGIIE
ncbi:hypothetical protein QWY31_15950 [Cytophagales bacterium LB-30]|uniref:Transcriptional regulator, AbiEi antitoxin, Type IV TA system n=1 Tax=Shiella aurantiaca TaxID=3058365 RepID=A0ABT8F945_9BACT|nr:DUF6577 family protein [Shiella aurantiaca]MDN4167005.1 hypothetical protein [Shiella aurantiaca]